jgi:hypothetical protein
MAELVADDTPCDRTNGLSCQAVRVVRGVGDWTIVINRRRLVDDPLTINGRRGGVDYLG